MRRSHARSRLLFFVGSFLFTLMFSVAAGVASVYSATPDEIRDKLYLRYANVLAKYVSSDGLVSYAKLRTDGRDLDAFLAIIDLIKEETIASWSSDEQAAFWINVYNAHTVRTVLNGYPIESHFYTSQTYPKKSIRQIPGVRERKIYRVAGADQSLESIEAKAIAALPQDPRIYMALADGTKGGPPLRNEPYEGARLSDQLDDQARRFIAKPDRFRIDRIAGMVLLSPIFDWHSTPFIEKFGAAFGRENLDDKSRAALEFVSHYLALDDRAYLGSTRIGVVYLKYDWTLNDNN